MLPPWVEIVSAVTLLAVLGVAILRPFFQRAKELTVDKGDSVTTLTITGMTCSHCVTNVERALKGCAGVKDVTVDLKSGKAVVVGEAGYPVGSTTLSLSACGHAQAGGRRGEVTAVESGSEGKEEG